jgi:DNA invertase Pin-like site-specific DNA recombinase
MDTTPITACIYTRISQDQDGERAGVTRQYDDCIEHAQRLGYTVVTGLPGMDKDTGTHFDDNDTSAYSGKTRDGYNAMLAALQRGEFSVIVCWSATRLYRRTRDLDRLCDIIEATGVQISAVKSGVVNLSTADGRMIARILASVSQQEVEVKAERQRSANTQRRAQGRWQAFGRVPFGYTKVGEKKHFTLVPHEPEASMIRSAAARILAGGSLRSIAREWNASGALTIRGNPWNPFSVRQLLANPVYAGLVTTQRVTGERPLARRVIATGDWEPLFSEDHHRALLAIFGDPGRRRPMAYERKYIGSGVYRCGVCGDRLYVGRTTASPKYFCRDGGGIGRNRDGGDTGRNRPGGGHVLRSLEPVDELVTAAVLNILGSADITARLAGASESGVDLDTVRTDRAAWVVRNQELAAMFADGVIDGEQLSAGTTRLRAKITEADRVLADAVASSPASALLHGDPDELWDRWDATEPDMKGKIIDELMTVTIHKAAGKGPKFNPDAIEITPKL